jgi:hypothetical protein
MNCHVTARLVLRTNLLRRRTEARNAAVGSMVPGPIRRYARSGSPARGGHSTLINLGAGQSSDV